MKRRIVLSLVAGLTVVNLVTGCGSSSTSKSDTAASTVESTKTDTTTEETADETDNSEEAVTEDLSDYEEIEWPDTTITGLIPKPKSNIGKIVINSDENIWVELANTSNDDKKKYVKKCKDMGYTDEFYEIDGGYYGKNQNGYGVNIMFNKETNVMTVVAGPSSDDDNSSEEATE